VPSVVSTVAGPCGVGSVAVSTLGSLMRTIALLGASASNRGIAASKTTSIGSPFLVAA
jgi:hypothetical protein